MAEILTASFLTSASALDNSLPPDQNEVIFLGRSNVGKSSLINSLVNQKALAKSSSTPGKTRLINFFGVTYRQDDEKFVCRFVDLPGFGYAKVSKEEQTIWQKSLANFVMERPSIAVAVVLRDARHPKLAIDDEVDSFLRAIHKNDLRIVKVFTKLDKLNQKELGALRRDFPNALVVSSSSKKGVDVLRDELFNALFCSEKATGVSCDEC